jgi:hypothetical protein
MICTRDINRTKPPMRTLVDIPADLLESLDDISHQAEISRAEVIRRALREYVQARQQLPDVFGLIRGHHPEQDGLDWQRSLRDEWQ